MGSLSELRNRRRVSFQPDDIVTEFKQKRSHQIGWRTLLQVAFVTVCNTISLVFWVLVYLLTFTWILRRFFRSNKRLQFMHQYLTNFPVFHLLVYKTVYEKYFNAARVVFLCYPSERMYRDVPSMRRLMRWYFSEPDLVLGNLYWDGAKVGNIVLVPPLKTLKSPESLQKHVQWALDWFPNATFGFGGQLPAVCVKTGLPAISNERVVDGRVGTVALGRRGAERGVEWLRTSSPSLKPEGKLNLCVLGGGGFTGTEIGRACADLFANVFLLDTRFGAEPCVVDESLGPRVVGTSDGEYVGKADVVLVFLPSGDMVKPYLKFAHSNQVWIDDTHPPIPPPTRKDLKTLTNLFRLTARSSSNVMFPPLPNWRPQDLPGCLLTAMSVAMNQEQFKTETPLISRRAEGGLMGIEKLIKVAEGMGIELGIFPVEKAETFKVLNMSILPKGD